MSSMFIPATITAAGLLIWGGCIVALAALLTWQEHGVSAAVRGRRLVVAVVPGSVALLALILATAVFVMLQWSG